MKSIDICPQLSPKEKIRLYIRSTADVVGVNKLCKYDWAVTIKVGGIKMLGGFRTRADAMEAAKSANDMLFEWCEKWKNKTEWFKGERK